MNPSTKVFTILSLAAALGQIIAKSDSDDAAKWRGQKLFEAGLDATGRYPFPQLTKSKLSQIGEKIEEVCRPGEDISIVETLSFLVCGLIDIRCKTNPSNWKYIDPVLKRAVWAQEKFDPKYEQDDDHSKALEDYSRWAA